MSRFVVLLGLVGCSGGAGGMTEGMDIVPTGDGLICVPVGHLHDTVWVDLACEPGDGGADGVCQGTVGSSNVQVGIILSDVAQAEIPENSSQRLMLDTTTATVGARADIIVHDTDCVTRTGCPVLNCPSCDFVAGTVEVRQSCP